jgi:hypothetical protein
MPLARRADREHLPPSLPRRREEVCERVRRRPEVAAAVRARQARGVKQQTARPAVERELLLTLAHPSNLP